MPTIHSYLNFTGKAEDAFNFYKSVFGGEFAGDVQRFKDMPPQEGAPQTSEYDNWILHVALPIGSSTMLMGSDCPPAMGTITEGNNYSISISADSEEEAKRLFSSLAEGGKVGMPLDKAFWGDLFGMLTDRFGVQWMVSYAYSK